MFQTGAGWRYWFPYPTDAAWSGPGLVQPDQETQPLWLSFLAVT